MGRAFPGSSSALEHFVEITGSDGIVHHVGPFKLLADAERWIERNMASASALPPPSPVEPSGPIPRWPSAV